MRYDRQCQSCEHMAETNEPMMDIKPKTCPECGKKQFIRVVTTVPQVVFKGSWPGKDIEIERKYGFKHNPKNPDP
jgi:putative FmdB family regulatory protein